MSTHDVVLNYARFSDIYDNVTATAHDVDQAVNFLALQANGAPVLELGIGTGRIALPLQARGLNVYGIDISEEMVARLRAKPGGNDIQVVMGDFAEVDLGRTFSLVFAVFNTFFALLERNDQVRCFRNVARHLSEEGRFVVEASVPDNQRWTDGQAVRCWHVDSDQVFVELSRHDPVNQGISSQWLLATHDGFRLYPMQIRYAWPSEMDAMAQQAGLDLLERWGGWSREAFNAKSSRHISVYRRV